MPLAPATDGSAGKLRRDDDLVLLALLPALKTGTVPLVAVCTSVILNGLIE